MMSSSLLLVLVIILIVRIFKRVIFLASKVVVVAVQVAVAVERLFPLAVVVEMVAAEVKALLQPFRVVVITLMCLMIKKPILMRTYL